MTHRGSLICKAKLARQIEELRENGETASDYSNYSRKNYYTEDPFYVEWGTPV